jgi:hypothetical protein
MIPLLFKQRFPMDLDAHQALQALDVNQAPPLLRWSISLLGLT